MRRHVGDKLSPARRLLLSAAGVATLGAPVVAGALDGRAIAQAPTAPPRFEVASFKLSPPTDGPLMINLGFFREGRLTFANVTLNDILLYAYNLPSQELLDGLKWNDSVRFDIEAIAPADTPSDRLRLMLRQLLEERLHVVTRSEVRTMPYLALVVANGGHKMSTGSEPWPPRMFLPGHIVGERIPISLLTSLLARFERRLVIDRTGLTGVFNVQLEWRRDDGPADASVGRTDLPELFTAVQEQLGLRLEGRRGPMDVLVIQSAARVPERN
jgi:uncharacterized protein (TIGR03435 family)